MFKIIEHSDGGAPRAFVDVLWCMMGCVLPVHLSCLQTFLSCQAGHCPPVVRELLLSLSRTLQANSMAMANMPCNEVATKPESSGIFHYFRRLVDSIRLTLIVIGGAVILLTSARNTLTWYFQRFWGASGNFWQGSWERLYDLAEGDHFILGVWGTVIVTNLAYWGFNIFLLILDVTGRPKCLLSYKIQDNTKADRKKLMKVIGWVIFNQTFVAIPYTILYHYAMEWRGCDMGREVPTFQRVVLELCVFSLVEEILFYYSHRLMHHPRLYKHVHKMHHEWTAPVGVTAIYAHPVEHFLCNLTPPGVGPLLMGSHLGTAWVWFTIALVSTTISHCGYHFPYLPSPEAHDFHHFKFINNFGVLGILDRLHGTDNLFRASKAYQRHFLMLSLVPVKTQFPDEPSKGRKKSE